LSSPEELQIVDGNILVWMCDAKSILVVFLTRCQIRFRESTTPTKLCLGTANSTKDKNPLLARFSLLIPLGPWQCLQLSNVAIGTK